MKNSHLIFHQRQADQADSAVEDFPAAALAEVGEEAGKIIKNF